MQPLNLSYTAPTSLDGSSVEFITPIAGRQCYIANLQISPDFQAHQKKIWMALYLSGCGCGCGRRCGLYAEIRDKNKHV